MRLRRPSIFFLIFSVSTLLIGGVILTFHLLITSQNRERVEISEKGATDMVVRAIGSELQKVISDLRFISRNACLKQIVEGATSSSCGFTEDILTLTLTHHSYDQIRYIDETGMEVARVQYRNGVAEVVPQRDLQDKSLRYYFTETVNLSEGEIFVSPFDLNIEHGKIERPLKPMIRFGTPVFSQSGVKKGIVIINYQGKILLDLLREISREQNIKSMLVNRDGYWLKGLVPEDEWGFMLPERKDRSMKQVWPEVWAQMTEAEQGQVRTDEGIFTFDTVRPLNIGDRSDSQSPLHTMRGRDGAGEYYWKIVNFFPDAYFFERNLSTLKMNILLFLLLTGLAGVGSWMLASSAASRQMAWSQLEAKVVQRTAHLKAVLDHAGSGIITTDAKGGVTSFNPAAETIFGWSATEIMNHSIRRILPEWRRLSDNEDFDESADQGPGGLDEAREGYGVKKDGTRFPIEMSISRMAGGFIFILSDITRRKATEKKLRRTQASIDQSNFGVCWADVQGRSLYMNRAWRRLFNLEETPETSRLILFEIMPGVFDTGNWDDLVQSAKTEKSTVLEQEFDRRGATGVRAVEITLNYQKDEGGNEVLLLLASDVSVRRENQKNKIAKKASDEANQAKSEFLARMSHEIRTPMNAVLGLGYLMGNTDLTSKQRDYLTKINGAARSLLGLINDILDFSKIEAGKMEIENIPFDLDEVLENFSNLVTQKAREKGVEILFEVGKVPHCLIGDPLRLGQILTNLGSNAVKFTEDGEIVIKVDIVESTPDTTSYLFSIRDTGIGMTHEQMGRLFHSFSQADGSTTRKFGGSGLGLAICKRLVEMMGGEIRVESAPGSGSTFSFTIPFRVRPERSVKKFALPNTLKHMRCLIVDDKEAVRNVMVANLSRLSFRAEPAGSGLEALEKLKTAGNDPFKLMLIDLRMPEFDGIETVQMVNAEGLAAPPVPILMTAWEMDDLIEEAERVGIQHIIYKPATLSTIFDTIMNALGREKISLGCDLSEPARSGSAVLAGLKAIEGSRLLLVEDNDINQQVAGELLQSAGMAVDIAANGHEAVKAVREKSYAAVLMDIQMPGMDGYEATATIRKDARYDQLPIIAMTAHAMSGEREKCLDAGMNDYVSKPIDPDKLFSALLRWVPPHAGDSGVQMPPLPRKDDGPGLPGVLPGIDIEAGLKTIGGNKRTYRNLLLKFAANNRGTKEEIKRAIHTGDIESSQQLIHTLKGVSGNIGARTLSEAARVLETVINSGGGNWRTPLAEVSRLLDQAIAAIELLEDDREPTGPSRPKSPQQLLSSARELRGLLEGYSGQAVNFFETLRPHLNTIDEIKGSVSGLDTCIRQYQFEEASERLGPVIETLKSMLEG